MIRWVYLSLRNLCYYYRSRPIRSQLRKDLRDDLYAAGRSGDSTHIRYCLTRIYLAHVGLTVAQDQDQVPAYVPLSAIQKEWADKVSAYGYQTGFL